MRKIPLILREQHVDYWENRFDFLLIAVLAAIFALNILHSVYLGKSQANAPVRKWHSRP